MNNIPNITILYAGIFGLLLIVLSLNIFREWVHVASGRHPDEKADDTNRWRRSERVQQSFVEFVPMTLLLLFLIEIHGAPLLILHGLGSALLAARIMHAYGSLDFRLASLLRVFGTQLTLLVVMICSLAPVYYALVPALASRFSGGMYLVHH